MEVFTSNQNHPTDLASDPCFKGEKKWFSLIWGGKKM